MINDIIIEDEKKKNFFDPKGNTLIKKLLK